MNRTDFRKNFKTLGPVILPVIHVVDEDQSKRNIQIALGCGAPGVFLINHDFEIDQFLPIIRACRASFPSLWMGVNFLGVTGLKAFGVLGELAGEGALVDAYWADDACINEHVTSQQEANAISQARLESGWDGMYFGGTAFKKQRPVDPQHWQKSARIAVGYMDVVTTSGVATGQPAARDKIHDFRVGSDISPLAVASGVTPENFIDYANAVDAVLVATGINYSGDFYNIDPKRLAALVKHSRMVAGEDFESQDVDPDPDPDLDSPWYLQNMAPNVKDPAMAWLDPSSAYVNAKAFHSMLDTLCRPFKSSRVDVVAGIDAAGYVLGAAMADRLGVGFLTIRKAGKLPVPTDEVDFVNYTHRPQKMELRKPAFKEGAYVLLVDQWVETGGTMGAGIELIEKQGGRIAGIASICIEETPAGQALRERYHCATCVQPGSAYQLQCNNKKMQFFDNFNWESILP
ncbi:MAG: BtpA/SgcQ family protein [Gammaproteobacteria bacterium]|jgi:adenine phosphoribosyltransferase|nr:BtpA/SgcQ family protein [Gammaproteobacteria bacterium]|tara:strand:+ start:5315 stop:6694 length:1380 start_codon:yes stop_codon:yes gene_type:complete